jgi:hypothetical protein
MILEPPLDVCFADVERWRKLVAGWVAQDLHAIDCGDASTLERLSNGLSSDLNVVSSECMVAICR